MDTRTIQLLRTLRQFGATAIEYRTPTRRGVGAFYPVKEGRSLGLGPLNATTMQALVAADVVIRWTPRVPCTLFIRYPEGL